MLDTVSLSAPLAWESGCASPSAGWTLRTATNARGSSVWATCDAQGVRLKWHSAGWLNLETSLPRLAFSDNAQLLTSWADCRAAMELALELAGDATGGHLPLLDDWRVSRADPVWAWGCDPAPYIAALGTAALVGTRAVRYANGVRWQTATGRVAGRCYDKAREQGHAVALPLRLERQLRKPGKTVCRLPDGRRVGATVGAWGADTVSGLIEGAMRDLCLDVPIHSPAGALGALRAFHGDRRGMNVWGKLHNAVGVGWDIAVPNKRTRQRYMKAARDAGVASLSPDGYLPALARPTIRP